MTVKTRKPDFGGYASKAGLECSDGLTILPHAFKEKDGKTIPLVWQHSHDDPAMVLGHALVEDRPDGTYVYGYFNDGHMGKQAKVMLDNGDVDSLSAFAHRLVKRGNDVLHGNLVEVSLVLAGANPGATIDFVSLQHSDSSTGESARDAILYTGLRLEHTSIDEGDTMAQTDDKETLADIYQNMTPKQKAVVEYVVGLGAPGGSELKHSAVTDEDEDDKSDDLDDKADDQSDDKTDDKTDDSDDSDDSEEDDTDQDDKIAHSDSNNQEDHMAHSVFDQAARRKGDSTNPLAGKGATLSHSDLMGIVERAQRGGSLRDEFMAHAATYGIDNIDLLFPDAKNISDTPEFLSRRMEWVSEVITKTKHEPRSRIRSIIADITPESARARGYIKGKFKKEEVFALLHRVTTPTTIYKKQKLDRDDILDITDIDVVVWLKAEMRLMLEEEIARAILIGDGRSFADEDKVKDPAGTTEGAGVRSIANDNDLYAHQAVLPASIAAITDANDRAAATIDELVRLRGNYKGSGNPVFFTTLRRVTDLLLARDKMGRRIYNTREELATAISASKIVEVEVMEDHEDLVGIYVNLTDYSVGTDRGGEISFFDDFDIDYNQMKYLLETRMSGALTKIKSAIVVREATGEVVKPAAPSFNDNTITIPSVTGVIYTINDAVVDAGPVEITEDTMVEARPEAGYSFESGATRDWIYTYTAG